MHRRRFLSRSAGVLAAGLLPGCSPARDDPPAPPPGPVDSAGLNRFACDLYGTLRGKPGNLFFSPVSAATALAMTAAGAKGNTLAEMRKALHLPDDPAAADRTFANLTAHLNRGAGYELSAANAVWGQTGYPWEQPFLDRVTGKYGAGFRDADFIKDPDGSRRTVNAWVEKETRDKIKELLPPGVIDTLTRMVLVNAIYFKGSWATRFDPRRTRPAAFTLADGKQVEVPMMSNDEGRFDLYREDGLQVLSMSYKGDDLSMLVALPAKPDGLPALEVKLSADAIDQWVKGSKPARRLDVLLPKFKIETDSIRLDKELQKLGMVDAFDREKADFSGMTTADRLRIAAVVHKAFVDVNEEGTEAAAATGVVMAAKSAPPTFLAAHPFLFLIRHNPTGAVLFLGRVTNPKEAA